ncbi:unnamed protein product [Gongylonema pulchrum]|uniref:EB domain-containing protein n=1 Tax=Gongylonema pulchrum TaxID=637853 RepID=A0A183DCY5_9BILA|nr:unnamed protein product [Gongylonema pulchrum]
MIIILTLLFFAEGTELISGFEVSSAPGERCIPSSNGQMPCRGGAVCINGLCVCPQGYVVMGDRCVPMIGTAQISAPGERCNSNAEGLSCSGGAVCVNEICICPADRVIYGDRCVQFRGYGNFYYCGFELKVDLSKGSSD